MSEINQNLRNETNEKRLTSFRLDDDMRQIADQSILIRASLRKNRRPENFSSYLRNLIVEDSKRNKELLGDKTLTF